MIAYIDTSAAAKFLVEESESLALEQWELEPENIMVSSDLLVTGLGRMSVRNPLITSEITAEVLNMINVEPITRNDFRFAGNLQGKHLRSLDALHLQMAFSLGADAIVTYDDRLADAAREAGLQVIQPGRG
jgi:predicted nucleic acid-binding protein